MTYTVDSFFQELDGILSSNGKTGSLSECVTLNVTHNPQRIAQLQLSLQPYNSKQLNDIMENRKTFQNLSWPAFENFIIKYLLCIRDFDPWSLIDSIDLFISVFEAETLLLNPKVGKNDRICFMLLPHFQETMSILLPLCELVDTESMHINNRTNDYPRCKYMSTLLLKALNNIRSTPDLNTINNAAKIDLLMRISIKLCEVYYKVGSPMLCSNVYSNINILGLNRRLIKKSLLVRYRFLMGKFYAHRSNFIVSFHHLNACFNTINLQTCPKHTVAQILKYLVPIGLIVGKVSNIEFVKVFSERLYEIYQPLIFNYKTGNLRGLYESIEKYRDFYKNTQIWIQLIQRLRVPVLRNLTLHIFKNNNGIKFNQLKYGLQLSIEGIELLPSVYHICEHGVSDEFVSNILISLSFNAFVKLKMVDSKSFVVSKTDTFPDMYGIVKGRYSLNPKESWLDN
ncbi:hypothetical protein CANINC_002473 [Pichia inconspicua]|uniref:PCI domain-containing protein n=1 Tax=Pichia inconspicua TaxID=52247 RepID=A0A4V4NFQ3_9ASCO|nr:hypothetical protein CANINC_002473 [[Candida] inconspicua]